jgi:hypothetical protein
MLANAGTKHSAAQMAASLQGAPHLQRNLDVPWQFELLEKKVHSDGLLVAAQWPTNMCLLACMHVGIRHQAAITGIGL